MLWFSNQVIRNSATDITLSQAIIHDFNKYVTTEREDLCEFEKKNVVFLGVDLSTSSSRDEISYFVVLFLLFMPF